MLPTRIAKPGAILKHGDRALLLETLHGTNHLACPGITRSRRTGAFYEIGDRARTTP